MKRFKQYVIDITSLTGSASTTGNIKIDLPADFFATELSFTSTGNFTIRLRDSGTNNFWMDAKISNANVFGNNTLPTKLPVAKMIKAGSTVFYEVTDTSTSTNTIQMVLSGYEIVPDRDLSYLGPTRDFRIYVIDVVLSSANQSQTNSIKIDQSKNFVITHITGNATSDSYKVQFADSPSGFTAFSNDLVNAGCFVGTGQYPRELPVPIPLPGQSSFRYTVKDYSGSANTIQLVLMGYVAE